MSDSGGEDVTSPVRASPELPTETNKSTEDRQRNELYSITPSNFLIKKNYKKI